MPRRKIEYVLLADVVSAERNPKAHDEETLDASIDRFGFTEPGLLDERTGRLIAGHGRLERLRRREEEGQDPPDGIVRSRDGWKIPIVRGWSSENDDEADAYVIASNAVGEGLWDRDLLAEMLSDLRDVPAGLDGVGYDSESLDELLADVHGDLDPDPDTSEYTRKVNAPHYEPTSETAPPTEDLYDTSRRDELLAEIDAADLPADVAAFLRDAAHRHTRFRYDRIAEFYAHADPDVQQLMENAALVIVDLDDAIQNGYVQLSDRLDALLAEALAD